MDDLDNFREIIKKAGSIKMKEPLAEILGAFEGGNIVGYSFAEVVKFAGHPCPTITGAYLCCKKALEKLYGNDIPVRGDITVTIYGEQDEGVYGVISQVFSFITGAAPSTGFKGLGTSFKRKDLLRFSSGHEDGKNLRFEFKRNDNGNKAVVLFSPQNIPENTEDSDKINQLFQKVLWGAAKKEEIKTFQDSWMNKIGRMLNEEDINKWIIVKYE